MRVGPGPPHTARRPRHWADTPLESVCDAGITLCGDRVTSRVSLWRAGPQHVPSGPAAGERTPHAANHHSTARRRPQPRTLPRRGSAVSRSSYHFPMARQTRTLFVTPRQVAAEASGAPEALSPPAASDTERTDGRPRAPPKSGRPHCWASPLSPCDKTPLCP